MDMVIMDFHLFGGFYNLRDDQALVFGPHFVAIKIKTINLFLYHHHHHHVFVSSSTHTLMLHTQWEGDLTGE